MSKRVQRLTYLRPSPVTEILRAVWVFPPGQRPANWAGESHKGRIHYAPPGVPVPFPPPRRVWGDGVTSG